MIILKKVLGIACMILGAYWLLGVSIVAIKSFSKANYSALDSYQVGRLIGLFIGYGLFIGLGIGLIIYGAQKLRKPISQLEDAI